MINGQCFKDNKNRVLNGLIKKRNNHITIENCKEFCQIYGYAFAGVQNSKKCFCGQFAPTHLLPESKCNKKCTGNQTQTCGGKWAINVYALSKQGSLLRMYLLS